MPPTWLRSAHFARRAYAGITPTVIGMLVALVLVFALGRASNAMLVMLRDGVWLEWLDDVVEDALHHAVLVPLAVLIIMPAINLGPARGWRRYALLGACVALASVACSAGRSLDLAIAGNLHSLVDLQRTLTVVLPRYGFMCATLTIIAELYRQETLSIERMHRAEVDRLTFDREMTEARLQVLQAQIEPHFLFNTLANVRRLYQTDLAAGRLMLEHLMRYLEVALPRMRDNTSSLQREGVLIEAYLNVQKIRMGRRLAFAVDIPDALRAAMVPSMMLLTLVENAIKHGLNPLLDGGRVDIVARASAGRLVVTVADTGRGFGEGTSGGGTGIANIRARLSALFGSAAGLDLHENRPTGIVATLVVPVDTAVRPEGGITS